MALINTETFYDVSFLLGTDPGKVDAITPATLVLDPLVTDATATPVVIAGDGTAASFSVTKASAGEVPYTLTFDKNTAEGVLDLVHTGTLQFVAAEVIGADSVVVTERPAV
jgi:hypothetical protein